MYNKSTYDYVSDVAIDISILKMHSKGILPCAGGDDAEEDRLSLPEDVQWEGRPLQLLPARAPKPVSEGLFI